MDRESLHQSSEYSVSESVCGDVGVSSSMHKDRVMGAHAWMRVLRFPLYSVARLRKLRIGERVWVGFLPGRDLIKGATGHCEAYFDRVRGGLVLSVASTLRLPGQRFERPQTEARIVFNIVSGNMVDFGACYDPDAYRDVRRICRYLDYFDRHARGYGFEPSVRDPEFRSTLWRGVELNKSGRTWRLVYGPKPRGLTVAGTDRAVSAELLVDVSEGRGRKNLFGRPEVANVYRRARDLIVKNKVFRLVQVSESEGVRTTVICNLWRIDRLPDSSVKTFEFSLVDQSWSEVKVLERWPEIPFYPVVKTQSLDWWRGLATKAIWKALYAAGYDLIPDAPPLPDEPFTDDGLPVISAEAKKVMPAWKMSGLLIAKYLGRQIGTTKKGVPKYKQGFLTHKSMVAGARALRAAIFDQVIDRDILSAVLAIDYRVVTLRDYLMFSYDPRGLLRVSKERRNLLPMLPQISREYWNREDLFSRDLWVRNGRVRTLVDYKKFNNITSNWSKENGFSSFSSKAAFRWICRAQLTVVRRWAISNGGAKDITVLENLSKVNVDMKVPAVVWCCLVQRRRQVVQLGVGEGVQRLYRIFVLHCVDMWKREGFAALKRWLWPNADQIGDIADWLAAEGFAQGQPERNATWASLHRRSVDWHERVAVANYENGQTVNDHWESLLPEFELDGVVVSPLNSTRDVALEGYRQHHCVGDYAYGCVKGDYRVYTVVEPDGVRSTVGLWLTKDGNWVMDQHRGKYNDPVSASAARAGKHLVASYQAEYKKNAGALDKRSGNE